MRQDCFENKIIMLSLSQSKLFFSVFQFLKENQELVTSQAFYDTDKDEILVNNSKGQRLFNDSGPPFNDFRGLIALIILYKRERLLSK